IIGLLATFLGRIIVFYGQKYTTATNVGFLIKLTSLTVIPFAYFMLDERMGKKVLIPFLIMVVGVFFLTTGGKLIVPRFGDILIIMLVVLLGFTNSLAKQIMADVDPNVVSTLRLLMGSSLLIGVLPTFFGVESFTPLLQNGPLVFIGGSMSFLYIMSFYRGIEIPVLPYSSYLARRLPPSLLIYFSERSLVSFNCLVVS
ncbi:MAG: EamA family transporter, partial [Candidatus Aenigmatarchaeota archaeon]